MSQSNELYHYNEQSWLRYQWRIDKKIYNGNNQLEFFKQVQSYHLERLLQLQGDEIFYELGVPVTHGDPPY